MSDTFDWRFYTTFYPDVANMNERAAHLHFHRAGQREHRVPNAAALQQRVEDVTHRIQREEQAYVPTGKAEERIHILIRTCLRPHSFEACIQSIVSQHYSNWRVSVAYDHPDSLSYLQEWLDRDARVDALYVNMDHVSQEKYRFNLYNNVLLDRVDEGYVMFLDDDDVLTHPRCLKMMNDYLPVGSTDKMLLWHFARPDQVICPRRAPFVRFGEIDTSCACFHHSLKKYARWPAHQGGDFAFYSMLMRNTSPWLHFVYLQKILTRTQFSNRMASFGKRGEWEEETKEE